MTLWAIFRALTHIRSESLHQSCRCKGIFQSHPKKTSSSWFMDIEKRKMMPTIHPTKIREKWALLCNFRSIQYLSRTSIKSKGAPAKVLVFAPTKKRVHTVHAVLSDWMKLQDCCLPWPQAHALRMCLYGNTWNHNISVNILWFDELLNRKWWERLSCRQRNSAQDPWLKFCWTRTASLNYSIIARCSLKRIFSFAGAPRLIRLVPKRRPSSWCCLMVLSLLSTLEPKRILKGETSA